MKQLETLCLGLRNEAVAGKYYKGPSPATCLDDVEIQFPTERINEIAQKYFNDLDREAASRLFANIYKASKTPNHKLPLDAITTAAWKCLWSVYLDEHCLDLRHYTSAFNCNDVPVVPWELYADTLKNVTVLNCAKELLPPAGSGPLQTMKKTLEAIDVYGLEKYMSIATPHLSDFTKLRQVSLSSLSRMQYDRLPPTIHTLIAPYNESPLESLTPLQKFPYLDWLETAFDPSLIRQLAEERPLLRCFGLSYKSWEKGPCDLEFLSDIQLFPRLEGLVIYGGESTVTILEDLFIAGWTPCIKLHSLPTKEEDLVKTAQLLKEMQLVGATLCIKDDELRSAMTIMRACKDKEDSPTIQFIQPESRFHRQIAKNHSDNFELSSKL